MSEHIRYALEKAAEAVLSELSDRKGLGNELEQCDDETKAEIGRTVATQVVAAFLLALPHSTHKIGMGNKFGFFSAEAQLEWAEAVLAARKDREP